MPRRGLPHPLARSRDQDGCRHSAVRPEHGDRKTARTGDAFVGRARQPVSADLPQLCQQLSPVGDGGRCETFACGGVKKGLKSRWFHVGEQQLSACGAVQFALITWFDCVANGVRALDPVEIGDHPLIGGKDAQHGGLACFRHQFGKHGAQDFRHLLTEDRVRCQTQEAITQGIGAIGITMDAPFVVQALQQSQKTGLRGTCRVGNVAQADARLVATACCDQPFQDQQHAPDGLWRRASGGNVGCLLDRIGSHKRMLCVYANSIQALVRGVIPTAVLRANCASRRVV